MYRTENTSMVFAQQTFLLRLTDDLNEALIYLCSVLIPRRRKLFCQSLLN